MVYFNENVGLYFYSTVFQGNMALAALMGVFVIYRLQLLNTERENKTRWLVGQLEDTYRYLFGSKGITFPYKNDVDILEKVKENVENQVERWQQWGGLLRVSEGALFQSRVLERDNITEQYEIFIKESLGPIILLIVLSGASIIALPFAFFFHSECPSIEIVLFISFIIFEIYTLYRFVSFFKKTIK